MKTYHLQFSKKGNGVFVNETDKKDKIKSSDILRFGTGWTREKLEFVGEDGFFDRSNCFIMGGNYGHIFLLLSSCGEVLTTEPEPYDLIEVYESNENILEGIGKLGLRKTHDKFEIGQIITFYAGYNGDILYKSRITGFGEFGEIYVLWDCYWSPIRDEEKRKIEIVKS